MRSDAFAKLQRCLLQCEEARFTVKSNATMKTVKEALAQVCADFDDLNIFDSSRQNEKPKKNLYSGL